MNQLLPKLSLVIFGFTLSVLAISAKPYLELVSNTPDKGSLDSLVVFQTDAGAFTATSPFCERAVAIHAADSHRAVNLLTESAEVSLNGRHTMLPYTLDGEPKLLAFTPSDYEPVFYTAPLRLKSFTAGKYNVQEKGYASVFENEGNPYALFQKNPGGLFTEFLRIDLSSGEEHQFVIDGCARENAHHWIYIQGKPFAVVHQGIYGQGEWFGIIDPMNKIPPRKVEFPFIHPGGSEGLVTTRYAKIPMLATLGRRELSDGKLHVGFFDALTGANQGGILTNFDLQSFSGSFEPNLLRRESPTIEFAKSNLFEEAGQTFFQFVYSWTEISRRKSPSGHLLEDRQRYKQYFVYNRDTTKMTQMEFLWTATPEDKIKAPSLTRMDSGTKDYNELSVFQGPGGIHYGLLVTINGKAYLVRLSTGKIIAELPLPRHVGTNEFTGELYYNTPTLYSRVGDAGEEYFFTGITRDNSYGENARRYTGRIHFPD